MRSHLARKHGGGNIAVAIRLLESLRRIAQRTPAGARLQAVALQARLVAERAAAAADNEHDRGDIEGRFQAVLDIAASAPGKEDAKR
jgi:uncharacterized membrane protein